MKSRYINAEFMEILFFSFIGIISRLVPHLPNMTTIGAASVFMGAKFGVKKGMLVMLLTMLITDSIKGLHSVMWATYGALFIAVLIGKYAIGNRRAGWIMGGTLLSSLIFFIVSNFAVWLSPHFMYPLTPDGLMRCYVMALPFFRNSLIGDVLYTVIFFGVYDIVLSIKRSYSLQRQIANQ